MSWSLEPGDVLAHYRVLSPLGSGGMGQVYLAEDTRLGRKLALKILSPRALRDEGRLRRFEREARTVSALNHPNILTIYDIGQVGDLPFIATEYIDGVTLRTALDRGRLDARHAVDIALQVVQALAAAHAAGVIHRDLKPENVMVREDGYVKVLDFGLAKLTGGETLAETNDGATQMADTHAGVVMGTFSYMAPEQARGADIDPRVDLFAFGVLLYEMLAGEPPFKGSTPADVIGALLFQEPEPLTRIPEVPDQLAQIVMTALRKDPDVRYQSAAQLLRDLRTLSRTLESPSDMARAAGVSRSQSHSHSQAQLPAHVQPQAQPPAQARPQPRPKPKPQRHQLTPPPSNPDAETAAMEIAGFASAGRAIAARRSGPVPRRRRGRRIIGSLAVLPLVNHSEDEDLDYLSDGLTESLINNLSQIPRLRVMARSTVFRYKGQKADPQTVGRELDVQAVLTGRIMQRGGAYIVGAELVDVDDGAQLWGTTLNRRPSDVFVLQEQISHELTDALRLRLTRDESKRLNKRHTVNAEAYQLYLRGRYFMNRRTGDALAEARTLFERAVAADPAYALAYAGLADCCSLIAVSVRARSTLSEVIEQARTAAMKALELDESVAEGHASLAFIKFRFEWDWEGAEAEFRRALELNPGHAPSRQWHAMFLASRARFDAALAEMRQALDLDPMSLVIQAGIGRILHFAGRYDEAVGQYEHVLQTDPRFAQGHIDLALTRLAREEFAATRSELARAEELLGAASSTIVLLRACCAVREGLPDEGRAGLKLLLRRYAEGTAGPDDVAFLAAVLGEWGLALEWLEEACARRSPFLGYVGVEPAMAALFQDDACRTLLASHGFSRGFTSRHSSGAA